MTSLGAAFWNRVLPYTMVAVVGAVVVLQVVGWSMAASVMWRDVTPHVARIQSVIVLCLGLLTIRAATSAGRKARRVVVATVCAAALVGYVLAPLPLEFEGNGYMPDGVDKSTDREKFELRFPIAVGPTMNFHSHLGDLLMVSLDRAYMESGQPDFTARAYATVARLGGLLFVIELLVVAAWLRWSRRICRYVGLALASPLSLLFFGFYELGYLALSAAVIPLLAVRRRPFVDVSASTLLAGLLQGLHTALHGFGVLGLAGGALALLTERGESIRRVVRTFTFASAGVAMYLGWVFIYVVGMKVSVVADHAIRGMGLRHFFDPIIYDSRIAYPVFSYLGLGEIGVFSLLGGVPLFVLAAIQSPRFALAAAAAFALPGLCFLIVWWPPGLPYNLDLLMAAFPGLFAALWLLASSRRRTMWGVALLVILHSFFWTTIGSAAFGRVWVEAPG